MAVKSKKLKITDLVKGMYISRLDRPWIETSYPIEGFYIQNDEDIRKLSSLCKYVYIDVDLTRLRLDPSHLDINAEHSPKFTIEDIREKVSRHSSQSDGPTKSTIRRPLKPLYIERVPFEKEFKTANKLYETLSHTAEEVLQEVSSGKSVNVEKVNQTASSMVDSIIRNPDAFLWLSRLKAKDTHTHNRAIRSTIWGIAFGRYMSLSKQELNDLSIALLMSGIGKAKLPRELLEKSDELTGVERSIYQKHINYSVKLLRQMGAFSSTVINIVASYCERFDGSGYPRKLQGSQIFFPAQIAGIVSYYEKITNHRDPEKSLDATCAMEHLYKLRDSKFQGELIEEFIQSIGIYPAGSLIELNSREVAVIVEQNEQYRLLPKVIILRDPDKKPVSKFKILDLSTFDQSDKYRPKIINSIPLGSYDIDAQEILDCILKADKGWLVRRLFS